MALRLFHVSEDAGIARFDPCLEMRVLQWSLCDAAAGPSLRFSIIRKRNAERRRA